MDACALTSTAMTALAGICPEDRIASMCEGFDLARLRRQLVAHGACDADVADIDVARLYFSKRYSNFSPNAFFDEAWYLESYADVAESVRTSRLTSGFVHFMVTGLAEGRWPNLTLHAEAAGAIMIKERAQALTDDEYFRANPQAAAFKRAFPGITALHHYNAYGRFLSCALPAAAASEPEFDAEFYAKTYLQDEANCRSPGDVYAHYLDRGLKRGHSPNAWFDERWYRTFYSDVATAIEAGWIRSGFIHYQKRGRVEGRLPRYNLTLALESRMPGVTNPSLLSATAELRKRTGGLQALPSVSQSRTREPRIWFLLPTINPDIMFGGYRAALELIGALQDNARNPVIVCVDEQPNMDYLLLRLGQSALGRTLTKVAVYGLDQFAQETVGPGDAFVAYTVWDLRTCEQLAARTSHKLPYLLAQEYEPIFYEHGARRALCEACYAIPHVPIINSSFLLTYLRRHGIGVFAESAKDNGRHALFEHKISQLNRQTATAMAARQTRLMAVYARPEAHAARNLFEMIVIALQELCGRGLFGSEWSFIGFGALSELPPVPLGGGHQLVLNQKMPEPDYQRMIGEMDIGISMMSAPHPSVMPFEFATTGALVVTNTYENRSPEELRAISRNIVPCSMTIDSMCDAILTALALVSEFSRREREALRPKSQAWANVFTPGFLERTFPALEATVAGADAIVIPFPEKLRQSKTASDPRLRGTTPLKTKRGAKSRERATEPSPAIGS